MAQGLLGLSLLSPFAGHLRAISLDNWSSPTANSGSGINLLGVTFAKNLFVAVGEQGMILTSADGSNWVKQVSGTTIRLRSVSFGKGQFIAVGGDAAPNINRIVLTSSNGLNWVTQSYTVEISLGDVTFGNGTFVAVAGGFTSDILTSTNASNWTVRATVSGLLTSAIFASNNFVIVGNSIQTSRDGITWSNRFSASQSLRGIVYGRGLFVGVGDGTPSLFVVSKDGTNWTGTTPLATGNLKSVDYDNSYFVGVGGGGAIVSSPDGTNWVNRSSGSTSVLRAISHGNSRFVAVADGGTILQSGLTAPILTGRPSPVPGYFEVSIYADTGRTYTLEATTNFVNWTPIFSFPASNNPTVVSISPGNVPLPRRFFRVSAP